MSRARKVARGLTVVIVNLIVLEVASFLIVSGLGILSPNHRWDHFLDEQLEGLDDAEVSSFLEGRYDAELGWDNLPDTQASGHNIRGDAWIATYDSTAARVSCLADALAADPVPLIATYGDSFTHGDEVSDDVTWQCALEHSLGHRVANYGVGGYGADQALLKAERHWREGRIAPITVLAVYEDGLRRAMNLYRPFLAPNTDGKLGFKPGFGQQDNELMLLPNPWHADVATVEGIRALASSLIGTDYWARGAARVVPEFPYSARLIAAAFRALQRKVADARYSENIWEIPEGRKVMLQLLERFTTGARQHGTRPVLLMIPQVNDWQGGRVAPEYRAFIHDELPKSQPDLLVIDLADAAFDEREFSLLPFKGHPSAYGNQVIAQTLQMGLGLNR